MKSTDLRIGNLIDVNGSFEAVQSTDLLDMELFWPKPNKKRKPIPLTEKRLDLLGFKEVKAKAGVLSAWKRGGVRVELSNSGNFYWKNKPMPYVHLLQNVYFFNELSGEELNTTEL